MITKLQETYDSSRKISGYHGEVLVKKVFEDAGFAVLMNPDQFGPWDMFVANPQKFSFQSVQVKTIQRYVIKNTWSIKNNVSNTILDDLLSTDLLIIVNKSPSNPRMIDTYAGKIYGLRPKTMKYLASSREIVIPCDQEYTILHEIPKEELRFIDTFDTRN